MKKEAGDAGLKVSKELTGNKKEDGVLPPPLALPLPLMPLLTGLIGVTWQERNSLSVANCSIGEKTPQTLVHSVLPITY